MEKIFYIHDKCRGEMLKGTYKCTTKDYEVQDNEGNLVFTRISNHEIPENDEEINTTANIVYCTSCSYAVETDTINYDVEITGSSPDNNVNYRIRYIK